MKIRTYYWREQFWVKNLGDYIAVLVLEALGYRPIRRGQDDYNAVNQGRCLFSIGSLLSDEHIVPIPEPIDVWGCGLYDTPLHPEHLHRLVFHAVRGPLTVQKLALAADLPLGDPALLLPQLYPHPIQHHQRTLVIPHYDQTYKLSSVERCRQMGCDELLSTQVIGSWLAPQRLYRRHALALIRAKLQLGITTPTAWQAIDRIAGASFVMTESLHGAILAQAYGVPWAAYTDTFVSTPLKWLDWAAYLGVELQFVKTIAQGQQWWERQGQYGRTRDLYSLVAAYPYPVAADVLKRFTVL